VRARAAAVCAAALCALWVAPPVTLAQRPPAAVIELAAVGFDGRTRPGVWTPVWVDITAGASDIDGVVVIEAPVPSGQPVVGFGAPVRAAAGARVRVFVPAIFFDARRPGSPSKPRCFIDGGFIRGYLLVGHRVQLVPGMSCLGSSADR